MNKRHVLIAAFAALVFSSSGYTASTESEEKTDSSSAMNKDQMPGMMGGMHHEGTMHHGMMRHHMMGSGMSPVTVMIYPGMMPMMGHGMMHHGGEGHHKGKKMHQEKMKHHQSRKQEHQEHMESMEQRLANIEKLLSQLLAEMQKNN